MTYFGFLALFLGVPILLLGASAWWDRRRGRAVPPAFGHRSPWPVIAALALIALLYTTPWDNYLVATRVWWYDPALVAGVTLGWVPLEEYLFFLLQPLLTGLWVLFLLRRLPVPDAPLKRSRALRRASVLVTGLLWLGSLALLAGGWPPGRYLALELAWALPPIMLQLGFGADILWQHRRLVLAGILAPALYLSAADALAIGSGTWTINPASSLGILLGGRLPLEEFLFFLLTNTLLVFGLALALKSVRLLPPRLRDRWSGRRRGIGAHPYRKDRAGPPELI